MNFDFYLMGHNLGDLAVHVVVCSASDRDAYGGIPIFFSKDTPKGIIYNQDDILWRETSSNLTCQIL